MIHTPEFYARMREYRNRTGCTIPSAKWAVEHDQDLAVPAPLPALATSPLSPPTEAAQTKGTTMTIPEVECLTRALATLTDTRNKLANTPLAAEVEKAIEVLTKRITEAVPTAGGERRVST